MKESKTERRTSSPAATGAVMVSVPRGADTLARRNKVSFFEIRNDATAYDRVAFTGFTKLNERVVQ